MEVIFEKRILIGGESKVCGDDDVLKSEFGFTKLFWFFIELIITVYIHENYLFQSIDGVYLQRQIVGDFSLFMGKIYNKKVTIYFNIDFQSLKVKLIHETGELHHSCLNLVCVS